MSAHIHDIQPGKILQLTQSIDTTLSSAWIPDHKGIPANELAETAIKETAHLLSAPNASTPLADLRRIPHQRLL